LDEAVLAGGEPSGLAVLVLELLGRTHGYRLYRHHQRLLAGERTQGEIYINLKADGRVVLNNREMSLDMLQETLYRVAEHFPGGAVIVRGDRDAMLGNAIAILDCCRKADIQNVSFAALPEEKKQP
ncbi:MAG: biopolymer transport protein ExbD, partial [Candidatus Hydrogenedentes bacterium]|nr:biopolymer transport protein ExbD [Candidatus Hydrogenedentota bacterium]